MWDTADGPNRSSKGPAGTTAARGATPPTAAAAAAAEEAEEVVTVAWAENRSAKRSGDFGSLEGVDLLARDGGPPSAAAAAVDEPPESARPRRRPLDTHNKQ